MTEKPKRTLTREEKDQIKEKSNYTCKYCKCENMLIMTVDHVIPLDRGGTDVVSNLACCCYTCNQLKGNLLPAEFREYLKALKILKKLGKFELSMKGMAQNVKLFAGVGKSNIIPAKGGK
jgi:5-methylcytosine-specific restriction endonuclease McrA